MQSLHQKIPLQAGSQKIQCLTATIHVFKNIQAAVKIKDSPEFQSYLTSAEKKYLSVYPP